MADTQVQELQAEIDRVRRMTVPELRRRYASEFGEATLANNKAWLVKRIAWRLQARAEGGLSERALRRAAELADDADLRRTPPRLRPASDGGPLQVDPAPAKGGGVDDTRLPPPGTILTRDYKGRTVRVAIRSDGFEYEGEVFRSLSAVAKRITGSHCNGFLFFRLGAPGERR